MMQDEEKNYDFIIIYSLIPEWIIHQIKNVTFNQIKKKITGIKIKLLVKFFLLISGSNLQNSNI